MAQGAPIKRLLRSILIVLFLSLSLASIYLYITFPDISLLINKNPKGTTIMEIRRIEAEEKRKAYSHYFYWAPIEQISLHLKYAVIEAEDSSFYQHHGFDWDAIRDAIAVNWKKGEFKRGGSTISQQLAKNLYLSPSKNPTRKIREAIITMAIERRLNKDRILELYLNIIEWGNGVYGAEAAARHYFNKSAQYLTPSEASWLASIIPSPRFYDRHRNSDYIKKRQATIAKRVEKRYNLPPAPKTPDDDHEDTEKPDQDYEDEDEIEDEIIEEEVVEDSNKSRL